MGLKGEKYTSDAALMGAVAVGRQDALSVVLDRYMPMVSRVSYRILCDRCDSEDVTQEVFIKVWRNSSGFDGRYSLSICAMTVFADARCFPSSPLTLPSMRLPVP